MNHNRYLELTIAEADIGRSEGALPVGCVIVRRDGSELGRGHNRVLPTHDVSAHAEIETIRAIGSRIEGEKDLVLYVSSEPCLMCLGAILLCPITVIVIASATTSGTGSAYGLAGRSGYDSTRFETLELISEPSPDHRLRSRALLREFCEAHGLWERVALLTD